MSSDYYIEINGKNIGTHHKGGYCSDPYDFTDIDEDFCYTIDVPSKKFVKDYVDSDGNIDVELIENYNSKHNLWDTIYSKCAKIGSCVCGCKIRSSVTKAKLVRKSNIRERFLNEVSSSDEVSDECFDSTNTIKNIIPTTNTRTVRNRESNTNTYANKYSNTFRCPKVFSESYKRRCSNIPCKFHPNCRFRYSKDRPCFFKHD